MKDLVEHIRAVHFTVLVIALILTAALQIEKQRPLERAASDAEAILLISQRWQQMLSVLNKEIKSPAWTPVGMHQATTVNSKLIFGVRSDWIYVRDHDPQPYSTGKFNPWLTLNDFLNFWEGIRNGKDAFLGVQLNDRSNLSNGCRDEKKIGTGLPPDREDLGNLFVDLVFTVGAKGQVWKGAWPVQPSLRAQPFTDTSKTHDLCHFDPYDADPLSVDIAQVFKAVAPQAEHWGTGDTKAEFSELIEASKHLGNTPLDDLANSLRDRANQETDRIELFQAKLPASAIPTYGSLILIFCQIYLLAHLVELREVASASKSTELPTGYIGLYRHQLIYVFTFLSLTIVPIIPLVIETLQNRARMRYVAIAALLTSLALGILCALVLQKVRNRLNAQPILEVIS
jgi:hypothetical protein